MILEDPASEKIIRPWLRGRDIKRWRFGWEGEWLLFVHRGVDIDDFPAIKRHLSMFREDLEPKTSPNQPRGRRFGNYEWYEIRDHVDYFDAFDKPKIIYPNIARRSEFALDKDGYLTNQKAFIIESNDPALLAYLNSSMVNYWFQKHLPKLRGGFMEPGKSFIKDLPLPPNYENAFQEKRPLWQLANKIEKLLVKDPDADISHLEREINEVVYEMYDLTSGEIELIERETGLRDDVGDSLLPDVADEIDFPEGDEDMLAGDSEPVLAYVTTKLISFPDTELGGEFSAIADQFTDLFCGYLVSKE